MGQLLVVQFVIEGIVKPTKVALTMQMGCDGESTTLPQDNCGASGQGLTYIIATIKILSDM
ncbi:unnamed protein product [Prunus armeniaca]